MTSFADHAPSCFLSHTHVVYTVLSYGSLHTNHSLFLPVTYIHMLYSTVIWTTAYQSLSVSSCHIYTHVVQYCHMDHCIPITLCFFLSHIYTCCTVLSYGPLHTNHSLFLPVTYTPNAPFSVRKGGSSVLYCNLFSVYV